jgi:hypothetical protein
MEPVHKLTHNVFVWFGMEYPTGLTAVWFTADANKTINFARIQLAMKQISLILVEGLKNDIDQL